MPDVSSFTKERSPPGTGVFRMRQGSSLWARATNPKQTRGWFLHVPQGPLGVNRAGC